MTKMAFAPMTYAPSAQAHNPRTNKNSRIIKKLAVNANHTIKTKGMENCTYSSTNWSINTVVQYLKHTPNIKLKNEHTFVTSTNKIYPETNK